MLAEPNPPTWPSSVSVFTPESDPALIRNTIDAAFSTNGGDNDHGQFSNERYAFLFTPGTYVTDVPVGYYTQVLGLGDSPNDVVFTGAKGVYSEEGNSLFTIGALNSFWRSAENFHTKTNFDWTVGKGMMWAVSQASPLRRVHIDAELILFEYKGGDAAGFASGGYLANSVVEGSVNAGSQQQWFTRNSDIRGGFVGGVWNMVFSGVNGAPTEHCGIEDAPPITTEERTPLIAEKPYISVGKSGRYALNIPKPQANTRGNAWEDSARDETKVDFSKVYVTKVSDTAKIINAKINAGLHIVITPAIYHLTEPIVVSRPNTVVLCIGLATLKSVGGNETIIVGDVDGVRIGGCVLEAGAQGAPALLTWGSGRYTGNAANPGFMYDIFARAGGPEPQDGKSSTDVFVAVNNGHVIGDNLWLWRADHGVSGIVKNRDFPVKHGLVVEGDDVTMYGLAVEHVLEDGVIWNGNRGETIFFQCEYPYDVTQAQFGDQGYVAYRVGSNVTAHSGAGLGVYSFFRDYDVTVETAISCPAAVESGFKAPLTKFLNGKGTIQHIINAQGASVDEMSQGPFYKCSA